MVVAHSADWSEQDDVRVSDSAIRVGHGFDGHRMWTVYDLGGWFARIEADPNAPFDGPESVAVYLDMSDEGIDDAIDMAHAAGGVTAEVLRSVPLNDARKLLRRLRTDILAAVDKAAYELPERMTSLDDWIAFARAYASSAASNPLQPMIHLQRATGLSPNTLSARVRRARELGLLVTTGEHDDGAPWLVLGGDARYPSNQSEGGSDG
jgi:hypothetical protein